MLLALSDSSPAPILLGDLPTELVFRRERDADSGSFPASTMFALLRKLVQLLLNC